MASSGVERTGLLRKGPPPGCSRVLSTSRPPSPQASHTAGRWVCRRGQPSVGQGGRHQPTEGPVQALGRRPGVQCGVRLCHCGRRQVCAARATPESRPAVRPLG